MNYKNERIIINQIGYNMDIIIASVINYWPGNITTFVFQFANRT